MKTMFSGALIERFALVAVLLLCLGGNTGSFAYGQTAVSGSVVGLVTDTTGAVIPGANLTVKNLATGAVSSVASGQSGEFRFSLLTPGQYSITASAAGFDSTHTTVSVNVGAAVTANFKLVVGSATQTVEVTSEAPLVQTANADVSTTFSIQQIQNLPNPGNDITYLGQLAPGSVINSTNQAANGMFGYGNFASFGLPATSNNFTVNGTDENDPFFNVNNSGATNLLLGNNEIAESTVTSNAYSAQFGSLGGAQLNEITRSGGNAFHGNLVYWWDGRVMNANSYFNNQQGVPRPFVNDNQWAASIGGPIVHDKLFFFLDTEGVRYIFPTSNQVFIPSASYQTSVLASVSANNPQEVAYYQKLFAIYNNAPGASGAVPYIEAGGANPDVNTFRSSAASGANEWLMTGRLDYSFGANDKVFARYRADRGFQPTYTDPLNSAFNLVSSQPQDEGQLVETHSFSANIVNQLLIYGGHYSATFTPASIPENESTFLGTFEFIDGTNPSTGFTDAFNTINQYGFFYNGRRATQYGGSDDLSITRGAHTLRLGASFKRNDISDEDPLELTNPLLVAFGPYEIPGSTATFNNGFAYETEQDFPLRTTEGIAEYQLGAYVEDDWNTTSKLKLNYGLRLEHNSNPTCPAVCFSRLSGDFYSLGSAAAATGSPLGVAYNKLIASNQRRVFPGFEHVAIEPRVGFVYSPSSRNGGMVVRGGFGIFSDVFPGTIADSLLFNPPNDLSFAVFNGLLDPAVTGSGSQLATSNAAAFRSQFASGGSYNSIATTSPSFTQPSFTTPEQHIHYPTYQEWSLQIQKQFGRSTAITLGYIGNHGFHEPVQNNSANAYGFPGLPNTAPLPSFAQVNLIGSDASSNYNGGVLTVRHREKYIDLTVNYTYSHALDEISNGGFLPFNPANVGVPEDPYNLSNNYGNADYDVRHNVTANYTINLPYWRRSRVLTDNWMISGAVFYHTGFPYSVTDGNTASALNSQNFYGPLFATEVAPVANHRCSRAAVLNFSTGAGSPCLDINDFGPALSVNQIGRNQFFAPHYVDADVSLLKGFSLPKHEGVKVNVGAQFFNVLNHPNFAQPIGNISSPLFGLIDGTVSTPTSIFGQGLGGDASPRIVQLKGSFQF